jgi:hypothetical protein
MDAILSLLLTIMPPDAADAYVEILVLTDHPLPETFPPGVGHAVERFWKKHELWGFPVNPDDWTASRIAVEIRWCRQTMNDNPELPLLAELRHVPNGETATAALTMCYGRLADLCAMREYAVVADGIDDEIRRVEMLASYWRDVRVARDATCSILCRREAIRHARQLVGDAAWFSGSPVPICP